jgi:hypothetical protein
MGSPEGRMKKFLPRRPTDTKPSMLNFLRTLFLLSSPISSQSQLLPSSTSSLYSLRSSRPPTHKRKEKFFLLSDRGAIARTLPPKYATAPHYEVWGKAPPKKFFVTFPRGGGPTAHPGGKAPGRMPE